MQVRLTHNMAKVALPQRSTFPMNLFIKGHVWEVWHREELRKVPLITEHTSCEEYCGFAQRSELHEWEADNKDRVWDKKALWNMGPH